MPKSSDDEEIPGYAAFISHSSKDNDKAFEICESLEDRGLKCWISPRDIRPGKQYAEEIVHGIQQSRCLVVLISNSANESVNVASEAEEARKSGKPIFPVRIEDVQPSSKLSFYVSVTQWIDAWSGSLLDHVDTLAQSLADHTSDVAAKPLRQLSNQEILARFIERNLTALIAVIAIIILGIIAALSIFKSETIVNAETSGKIIESVIELVQDDLYVNGNAMPNYSEPEGPHTYHLSIGPSIEYATMVLRSASYKIAFDDGEFRVYERFMKNQKEFTLAGYQAFNIKAPVTPVKVSIQVIGPKGVVAGPFTYEMDFELQIKESLARFGNPSKNVTSTNSSLVKEQLASGNGIQVGDFFGTGTLLLLNGHTKAEMEILKTIRVGTNKKGMDIEIYLDNADKNLNSAFTENGRRNTASYLLPIDSNKMSAQLEFHDGDVLPLTINKTNRRGKRRYQFRMVSNGEDAPILLAYPQRSRGFFYTRGGDWGFVPIVGEEVSSITWSTYQGGSNRVEKRDGFFTFPPVDGSTLGLKDWLTTGIEPVVNVNYTFDDGTSRTFTYRGSWKTWIETITTESVNYQKLVKCMKDPGNGALFNLRVDRQNTVNTSCRFDTTEPMGKLFSEVFWGFEPSQLSPLDRPNYETIMKKNYGLWEDHYLQSPNTPDKPWIEKSIARIQAQLTDTLKRDYKYWRSSDFDSRNYFLMRTEKYDSLYFRFETITGKKSPVIKVPVQ